LTKYQRKNCSLSAFQNIGNLNIKENLFAKQIKKEMNANQSLHLIE